MPKERNGIAIDMRHDEAGELGSLSLVLGPAFFREMAIFVEREVIHCGDISRDIKLVRQTILMVADAI
jgi:hypothetical protein